MARVRLTLALAAVVGAALASTSCGEEETETTQPSEPPAANESPAAVSSGVESVPIPRGAESEKEIRDAWQVHALTFNELVAWYDERMPEGGDFRGWTWCETAGGEENPTRIYSNGTRRILSITITDDDPPGLLIGTDRSGPCEEIMIGL